MYISRNVTPRYISNQVIWHIVISAPGNLAVKHLKLILALVFFWHLVLMS